MKIFEQIAEAVVKQFVKSKITVAAKAPTIFLAGGITAVVGGTVVAIAQTSKADDAMDEFHTQINRIEETIEKAKETGNPEKYYPEAQQKQDYRVVYGHMIMTMAKIYLPVVLLESLGIAMICKSHIMMSKRNASLAAAYAALSKSYMDYRKRVADKYGEEEEKRLYYGYKEQLTTEKVTSENGVTTDVEKKKVTYNPLSPFSMLISEGTSTLWDKDPYITLHNLKMKEREANDILWARKKAIGGSVPFITVNEIAQLVGVEERPEWSVFVIYRDDKNPDKINFGLTDKENQDENIALHRFINRLEENVFIEVKPDGNLCDRLDIQFRNARIKEDMTNEEVLKLAKA
jgi:hypothetical protein